LHQFIHDPTVHPVNTYGEWNESLLADEAMALDLTLHLQELGNFIMAEKVVAFLTRPDVKAQHMITKDITLWTAQRYLHSLGYIFTHPSVVMAMKKKMVFFIGKQHFFHNGWNCKARCVDGQRKTFQNSVFHYLVKG